MATTLPTRRKPKAQRKDEKILIRITAAQKRVLEVAAERAGLSLSSWMRSVALRAAGDEAPPATPQAAPGR